MSNPHPEITTLENLPVLDESYPSTPAEKVPSVKSEVAIRPTVEPETLEDATPTLQLSRRLKIFLVILLSCCTFVDALGLYLVIAGLGDMENDLHMNVAEGTWYISSVTIGIVSTSLLGGRLSDHFGAKPVYVVGLLLFTASTGGGGFAKTAWLLLFLRGIQGAGAGLQATSGLKALTCILPDPKELSSGLAVFACGNALAIPIGSTLGALLCAVSWRWGFFANALLCVPLCVCSVLFLPTLPRPAQRPKFDLLGVVLFTGALICFILAFLTAGSINTWAKASVLVPLVISVLLFPAFFYWESTIKHNEDALIPRDTWKVPNFTLLTACAVLPYFVGLSTFYQDLTYWKDVFGFSAISIAWHLLPMGVAGTTVAMFSTFRPQYFKPRWMMLPAMALPAGMLVLGSFQTTVARYWPFEFPSILLAPLGTVTIQILCYCGMMQNMPEDLAGLGVVGAVQTTAMQIGSSAGTALAAYVEAAVDNKQADGTRSYEGIAWMKRFVAFYLGGMMVLFAVFYRPPKHDRAGAEDGQGEGARVENDL